MTLEEGRTNSLEPGQMDTGSGSAAYQLCAFDQVIELPPASEGDRSSIT